MLTASIRSSTTPGPLSLGFPSPTPSRQYNSKPNKTHKKPKPAKVLQKETEDNTGGGLDGFMARSGKLPGLSLRDFLKPKEEPAVDASKLSIFKRISPPPVQKAKGSAGVPPPAAARPPGGPSKGEGREGGKAKPRPPTPRDRSPPPRPELRKSSSSMELGRPKESDRRKEDQTKEREAPTKHATTPNYKEKQAPQDGKTTQRKEPEHVTSATNKGTNATAGVNKTLDKGKQKVYPKANKISANTSGGGKTEDLGKQKEYPKTSGVRKTEDLGKQKEYPKSSTNTSGVNKPKDQEKQKDYPKTNKTTANTSGGSKPEDQGKQKEYPKTNQASASTSGINKPKDQGKQKDFTKTNKTSASTSGVNKPKDQQGKQKEYSNTNKTSASTKVQEKEKGKMKKEGKSKFNKEKMKAAAKHQEQETGFTPKYKQESKHPKEQERGTNKHPEQDNYLKHKLEDRKERGTPGHQEINPKTKEESKQPLYPEKHHNKEKEKEYQKEKEKETNTEGIPNSEAYDNQDLSASQQELFSSWKNFTKEISQQPILIVTQHFGSAVHIAKILFPKTKEESSYLCSEENKVGPRITWLPDSLLVPSTKTRKITSAKKIQTKLTFEQPKDISKQNANHLNTLTKLFNWPKEIICACDPSPEGELYFRRIYDFTKATVPVKRYWTNSLNTASIWEGFTSLKPQAEFDKLYYKAMAREYTDWILDINYSSLLYTTQKKGIDMPWQGLPLSYPFVSGSLQLATQSQEKEKPQIYVIKEAKSYPLQCTTFINKNTFKIESVGKVVEYTEELEELPPPPLYNLESLILDAEQNLNFNFSKSIFTLENLHDNGWITFPYTDNSGINSLQSVNNIIRWCQPLLDPSLTFKLNSLPSNLLSKEAGKEGIYLVRNIVPYLLSSNMLELLDLIVSRSLQSISSSSKSKKKKLVVKNGSFLFATSSYEIQEVGWKNPLLQNLFIPKNPPKEQKEKKNLLKKLEVIKPLPTFQIGEKVNCALIKNPDTSPHWLTDGYIFKIMGRGYPENPNKHIGSVTSRVKSFHRLSQLYFNRNGRLSIHVKPTPIAIDIGKNTYGQKYSSFDEYNEVEEKLKSVTSLKSFETYKSFIIGKASYFVAQMLENKCLFTFKGYSKIFTHSRKKLLADCKCPDCSGNSIVDTEEFFICSTSSCNFKLFKQIPGIALQESEFRTLISQKQLSKEKINLSLLLNDKGTHILSVVPISPLN
eukprot:TRINITY_DN2001_c0_g1_i2.p1 TRINITY_DN2001_c0_g1~~TRINITY_DN2001_c0_g1_i2.p1  ORF type:complete len:1218 (-),score=313.96 TRINITY_DN2001_c0_g1_i2:47-3700(-)